MSQGKSTLTFQHLMGNGRANSAENPDVAYAYDEQFVRSLYRKVGMEIVEPIRNGSWTGRTTDVGYQDIVVSVKPQAQ